ERIGQTFDKLGADAAARGRYTVHDSLAGVPWPSIDIVIEAVPEQLELKRTLFRELETLARRDTPLCSNSSAIGISKIGEGLASRDRMLNTHYFMPAHLVPAVEVVSSEATDPKVADRVCAMLRATGRVPVRVKRDIPGFLANRLQHALSREAFWLMDQGFCEAEDIDAAVRFGFGFRYIAAGPCLQRDHAGLEVHAAAGAEMYPHFNNSPDVSSALTDRVAANKLGMKTGEGFYTWTPETIAAERARYEKTLAAAFQIIKSELDGKKADDQ
ncbi:MAG: 3-hydroxyacyl-CoA dehydrogenase, partial [Burkholderiales bacterium]|nr:3-hydroxyacyl-CoA dehydrogenase [Burkholderiales bacterium]